MTMMRLVAFVQLLLVTWPATAWMSARLEVEVLLDMKAALDPHGTVLMSWQAGERPCSGAFEGVLCDTGDTLSQLHCFCAKQLLTIPVAELMVLFISWGEREDTF